MDNVIQEQITLYLSDEEKTYQDWYMALTQAQNSQYTQQVGVIPPLSKLKELFTQWITPQQMVLKQGICLTFCEYAQQADKQTILIGIIADALATQFAGMPVPVNTTAVAVILVSEDYLAQWCDC